jgi:hypothetical protein
LPRFGHEPNDKFNGMHYKFECTEYEWLDGVVPDTKRIFSEIQSKHDKDYDECDYLHEAF